MDEEGALGSDLTVARLQGVAEQAKKDND